MVKPVRDISAIFGDMPLLDGSESFESIDCDKLLPFSKHPFNEISEAKKQVMAKSISEEGILNPIIVHKQADGKYMILAGHKRTAANILAGNKDIPCIIKEGLSEAQQVAIVNKTNLTQTGLGDLTYMEQARAYQLEYETLLNDRKDSDSKFQDSRCTREFLAKQYGMTDSSMRRYLALNKLIVQFQELLEINKLKFSVAVDISSLSEEQQSNMYDFITEQDLKISTANSKILINMAKSGDFDKNMLHIKDNNSLNIKLNENLKNVFKTEDTKSIKKKVGKSIEFSQIILPKWFNDNGISVEEDTLYDNIIELLDKIKNVSPEIIMEKFVKKI